MKALVDHLHGSVDPLPQPESAAPADSGEGDFFAFPMTAVQERIWAADCANPGNRAYNGSFRLSLVGPVDQAILELSLIHI